MTRLLPLLLSLLLTTMACGDDERTAPDDAGSTANDVGVDANSQDSNNRDGSADAAPDANSSCSFHTDCPLGTSCNFENECVVADCTNCADDPYLVCMPVEEHPDGVCSRPECADDADCDEAAGETCHEGLCENS